MAIDNDKQMKVVRMALRKTKVPIPQPSQANESGVASVAHHSPLSRDLFEPLWHQIKHQIKSRIVAADEGYRPGDKIATEEVLAREYGVNRLTVHKALRFLAREGLLLRRAGKGTFVAAGPASGGGAITRNIGFLIARDWWMSGPFVTYQIAGARKTAFEKEWPARTILSSVEHEPSISVFTRALDGLIVIGDCVEESCLRELLASDIPTVVTLTNRCALGLESVVFDEEEVSFEQTRHLIALGHRRIACINSTPDLIRTRCRWEGYRRAMSQAGLPLDEGYLKEIVLGGDQCVQAVRQLLALKHRPTGLVLPNGTTGLAALHAVIESGISVPGDISIISGGDSKAENVDTSSSGLPAMTWFSYSYEQIGVLAMERLWKRFGDPLAAVDCTTLHGHLIVNQTTGPASSK